MADPLDPGELTAQAPTPLQGLTSSLGLLPAFERAGTARETGLRASAERKRAEADALRTSVAEQRSEAGAARPDPMELPPPPSMEARPFLTPGKNVLDQLQTAMAGVTQLALGIGGLKGKGHAIAGVAALKGAMEGWQAGDRERADAAMREWDAASKALLETHRSRREAYADLLTDQQRSMEARLAEIGIRASIDGDEDAARAAKAGNIGDLIGILGKREMADQQFTVRMETLKESIAQHKATSDRLERDHQDLQRQREIANRRAQESLELKKQQVGTVLKLQAEDGGLTNKLEQMDTLEAAIRRLDARGVIPRGATGLDKVSAATKLQLAVGDAQVGADIENVKRMGTALLVGSEIAAGLSPSVARLKVIGEAEAAGATAIPKSFWDTWFERQRKALLARQRTVRGNLTQLGQVPPPSEADEYVFEKVE